MKINLEISGARIIITTLIALVLIGLVTGSHLPNPPNPGHGYDQIDGFDLLHVLQGNSNAIGFTGTTILGGPLAIGTTTATGLISLNAGTGGWDIGITQNQLGGTHTLELTTGDFLGNQATRFLIRGDGDFANIEFYGGASGSEIQNMKLFGTTGNLDVTGDVCANVGTASETCLSSGGFGTGQKVCILVKSHFSNLTDEDSILDNVSVPGSWTISDCAEYAADLRNSFLLSGGSSQFTYRVGCIFDSGTPKYSFAITSGSVPSRNCGW